MLGSALTSVTVRRDEVPLMSDQPADNPWGLAVSQMHAAGLVDMDGDGICGDVDVCPNDFDNDSDNYYHSKQFRLDW